MQCNNRNNKRENKEKERIEKNDKIIWDYLPSQITPVEL